MNNEIGFAGLRNLYGDNYNVFDITETDGNLIIQMKSRKTKEICPSCGKESASARSTYIRYIQETPFHNKQVWLRVSVHKYDCLNTQCSTKVFAESLPFAGRGQVRAHELTIMALVTATNIGNETASRTLSEYGVKMSNDTLTRIYQKLEFEDDPFVEEIGIDDVSNKKGQTYYTMIYELKTHRLLAMLESRDGGPLKEWLKAHNKVRLVARDRASAYASAINEILPNAVQVADRFHLIQNILEYAEDIVRTEIPNEIFFANGVVLDKPPKKEILGPKVDLTLVSRMSYDNSPPIGNDGGEITFDRKNHDTNSSQYKARVESREAKRQLARDIRKYNADNPGVSCRKLAAIFKVTHHTAKKYLSMTDQEIEAMAFPKERVKRENAIDNYINIIFKMLLDNIATEIIYAYVCQRGYIGKTTALLTNIENIKKSNFPERKAFHPLELARKRYPEGIEVVSRGSLLKHEFASNPKTKLNIKVSKFIDIAKDKFPVLADVSNAVHSFHSIIMGDSPEELDKFLKEYEGSKFKKFCAKIKKDIAPVKNAISYSVSSGFVEGCNNKFKLLKRSLYGRSKFVNLFKKCMLAFASNDPKFNLRTFLLNKPIK